MLIKKFISIFKKKKIINDDVNDINVDENEKNNSNKIFKGVQPILPFSKNKESKITKSSFKLPTINFLEKNADTKSKANDASIELEGSRSNVFWVKNIN